MSRAIWTYRSMVALLLVVLGLAIVGRGVIEGTPFAFTGMGVLMAALGIYRLMALLRYGRQH